MAAKKRSDRSLLDSNSFVKWCRRCLEKGGPDSPIPTTVIVFKDEASYLPFKVSENSAGYFQPGQDVNYITLSTESHDDRDLFSIIFHEYTHLLVNDAFGKTPAWFNEGLADLYSTLSVSDDHRAVIGRPIRRHISTLQQNALAATSHVARG
mgnify:CR=1 FL=1